MNGVPLASMGERREAAEAIRQKLSSLKVVQECLEMAAREAVEGSRTGLWTVVRIGYCQGLLPKSGNGTRPASCRQRRLERHNPNEGSSEHQNWQQAENTG